MPVSFEHVIGRVLAWVGQHPQVEPTRLGICGLGHGGYQAARAAALHPRELRACISIGGGYDHDHSPYLPELVRKEFQYAYALSQRGGAMDRLAQGELNLRGIPRLSAPLLAIHDPRDTATPLTSCTRLLAWARGAREFISSPLEDLAHTGMGRWMAEALAGTSVFSKMT
jgi:dienelactone hydrolase